MGGRLALLLAVTLLLGCVRVGYDEGEDDRDGDGADARVDASEPDSQESDASEPDAHVPDAQQPDAQQPDASGPSLLVERAWALVGVTPPGRYSEIKMIYSERSASVIAYGGRSGGIVRSGTWEYDGTQWNLLCDPCAPGPRLGHALVYDSSRDVVVLYGGTDEASTFYGDLWEWDGAAWQARFPGGTGPTPRREVYAAYDSVRRRMVIFGGIGPTGGIYGEVFEYDGTDWSGPFRPASRPSPRVNGGASATFVDSRAWWVEARQQVVIVGGRSGGAYFDDAWAWSGSVWTSLCTDCTGTGRDAAALGYDPASGRLVLVAGWDGSDEISGTWAHDGSGWTFVSPDPTARDSMGFAYDAGRDRFVLFGGNGDACGGDCAETLEFVRTDL